MFCGETHSAGLALVADTEEMVDIEVFLGVELFLENNVTMTAFERVVRRGAGELERV